VRLQWSDVGCPDFPVIWGDLGALGPAFAANTRSGGSVRPTARSRTSKDPARHHLDSVLSTEQQDSEGTIVQGIFDFRLRWLRVTPLEPHPWCFAESRPLAVAGDQRRRLTIATTSAAPASGHSRASGRHAPHDRFRTLAGAGPAIGLSPYVQVVCERAVAAGD
jgi:hypothetical protein